MKRVVAALAIALASAAASAGMVAEHVEKIDGRTLLMTNLFSEKGNSDVCPPDTYEARLIVNYMPTGQVFPYAIGCWNTYKSGEVVVTVYPFSGAAPFDRSYHIDNFRTLAGMPGWGEFFPDIVPTTAR